MELNKARVGDRDVSHGTPNKFFGALNCTGLRSLLGVAIELLESPVSFSVAIRTAVVDRQAGQVSFGIGSGIVWDSVASEEYDECLLKA